MVQRIMESGLKHCSRDRTSIGSPISQDFCSSKIAIGKPCNEKHMGAWGARGSALQTCP